MRILPILTLLALAACGPTKHDEEQFMRFLEYAPVEFRDAKQLSFWHAQTDWRVQGVTEQCAAGVYDLRGLDINAFLERARQPAKEGEERSSLDFWRVVESADTSKPYVDPLDSDSSYGLPTRHHPTPAHFCDMPPEIYAAFFKEADKAWASEGSAIFAVVYKRGGAFDIETKLYSFFGAVDPVAKKYYAWFRVLPALEG